MHIPEAAINRLADEVVRALVPPGFIKPKVAEKQLAARIAQLLFDNLRAEQAQRLLQMAEKGFEYGVKTRLEVDDAQTNLLRAQSNLARAHRDYLVASVNLQWAMGVAGE